jgi:hypothetical protein
VDHVERDSLSLQGSDAPGDRHGEASALRELGTRRETDAVVQIGDLRYRGS